MCPIPVRRGSRSIRLRAPLPLRWIALLARVLVGVPRRTLQGTARRISDPARQVVGYWASERSTIRQGFVANFISALTSLISGVVLAAMEPRLLDVRGLYILIPVSIGMRGNIFGALSARLGTAIHAGLFQVTRDREGLLYQNVYSSAILTVSTSVTIGLLARAIAALLRIDTMSVWDFIVVASVGGLLSSVFVLAFTVYLSIASYHRGWDLDSVGAVLITVVGDVVTLPCLLLGSYVVGVEFLTPALGALFLLLSLIATLRAWRMGRLLVRQVVHESLPILCVAIVLDILAGTVVEPRIEEVFTVYTAFLIFIPGMLENTGALGSILAARLGTKLHLGAASPSARPEPVALLDGSIVLLLGLFLYSFSAVTTLVTAQTTGAAYPGSVRFLGATMTGGLLAMLIAALIGYYAAIVTYRFGYDPDNHTIPLVTSGMDLLGTICLVAAIALWGVT